MLLKEEYRETNKQYGLKLTVQKKQCHPFVCTFLMEKKKDNVIYALLENGKLS
jgi:Fe-S cluster assembly iron-binding protein IscA